MRKLYRGTNIFGHDSMYYVKEDQVAFMFWPDGMPLEEIKKRLQDAERQFMYVGLDHLDTIPDLRQITEW